MSELSLEMEQRIAQLQEENRKLEGMFESWYLVIGKNYYEKPSGHREEIAAAVENLNSLKQQSDKNKAEILMLRGVRVCPNCGSEVEKGASFCGECGMRMEPVEQADENSIICGCCKTKNSKEKKFCAVCGQRLSGITLLPNEKEAKEAPDAEKMPEEKEAFKEELQEEPATEFAAARAQEEEMEAATSIHCPECKSELPPDALFCAECGARIVPQEPEQEKKEEDSNTDEIFCRECGGKLEPDAMFCPECGTPVKME